MSARYVVTDCEYHEGLNGTIVEIVETLPTGTAYVVDADGQRYAIKLRFLTPHTPDLDGLRAYMQHAAYDRSKALASGTGAAIAVNIALGGLHIPANSLKPAEAGHTVRMAFLSHVCGRKIESSTKDGEHKVADGACLTVGEAWALVRWFAGQEINGNGTDDPSPSIEWDRHDQARSWIVYSAETILGEALIKESVGMPTCYCCGGTADHQGRSALGMALDLCTRCYGDFYPYTDERYGTLWVFNCGCAEHTAQHIARERYWQALDEYNAAFGERKTGPRAPWVNVDWTAQLAALIADWSKRT